jgi:hypothetical protein
VPVCLYAPLEACFRISSRNDVVFLSFSFTFFPLFYVVHPTVYEQKEMMSISYNHAEQKKLTKGFSGRPVPALAEHAGPRTPVLPPVAAATKPVAAATTSIPAAAATKPVAAAITSVAAAITSVAAATTSVAAATGTKPVAAATTSVAAATKPVAAAVAVAQPATEQVGGTAANSIQSASQHQAAGGQAGRGSLDSSTDEDEGEDEDEDDEDDEDSTTVSPTKKSTDH